jgi:hypothetical protein
MEPNHRSRISLRSTRATKRRNHVTEDRMAGPTPALSLDRTGFAFDVTTFLQAREPFALLAQNKLGRQDAPENGGACHESPTRKLAQKTPSPQRGEGWGEGVRTLQFVLRVPNPLISSFSHLGGRDAACRPSADGATRMLHFLGRPLHMIGAYRVATREE